ncbi:MAG: nucleoid occlusion factor SlmA [Gammaproteobacteria bacterium]|nr:nucleoid occlusion factor SlmA [Gammaproteobacteria bacterium]
MSTAPAPKKPNRREEILTNLAQMLESQPGARLTTAKLAASVGVSEAALYRHFPSKARMFEALIAFAEETIFERITLILSSTVNPTARSQQITTLILTFCERNPGITRLLAGDPLAGEVPRLRQRASQFFERIETQLRQVFREADLAPNAAPSLSPGSAAHLLACLIEGRVLQFVRSDFTLLPTHRLPEHLSLISQALSEPTATMNQAAP